VWDAATRKTVRVFHGQGTPSAIAVSPNGKTLATGDLNGSIRLWDLTAARSR
jgi:WD40 repeat protein